MPSVNEMLDEETIVANTTPGKITLPTDQRDNEVVWFGIVPHATEDIRLVRAGETQGQLIPSGGAVGIWGPFRLASVLAGRAPSELHAASLANVQVVVYRSA